MPSPFGLKFHLPILSLDANWYQPLSEELYKQKNIATTSIVLGGQYAKDQ
jgi:hypothetical protein